MKHAGKPPLWSAVKQQEEDEEDSAAGTVVDLGIIKKISVVKI